jgi:hypothetical protein
VRTEALPKWVIVVRAAGILLGVFLLCSGLAANLVASEPEQRLRPAQFVTQLCLFTIAALPLIVRWRAVTTRWFRRVLLFLLAADAIYFSYSSVASVVWAVHHGERTQVVCFSILGFLITLTIVSQFPAVLHLTKTREPNVA